MSEAISFNSVTKYYQDKTALDNVSFKVSHGMIHGLLGPNGAGKSTTMKLMTGLIEPSEGEISFDGKVYVEPHRHVRMGYLSEFPPLYPNQTVEDYLVFLARLRDIPMPVDEARSIIQQCGLAEVSHRLIRNLSKGFKQKVGIAQALVGNPEIVILDEPTSGLDPQSIIDIRELILSLRGRMTILISTHLLHEANLVCDEITVLDKGVLLQTGELAGIANGLIGHQVIKTKVKRWDQELFSQMRADLGCEIRSQNSSDGVNLTLYFNDSEEKMEDVSTWLVQNSCGLLYLKNEAPDLEEIFRNITGREK